MEKPRVTIRDIAAKVGLHFTTVALALRDSTKVNATTRRRVQEVAGELGYQPDPMLAALNAYRRSRHAPRYQATIAWIDNWPRRREMLENQEFNEYFQGAAARARELGYLIEEFWLHAPGMSPERLTRILRARNIQALLMAPQPRSNMSPGIDYRDYAVVALGYSLQPAVLHVVTNHHAQSMTLTLTKLRELGYRRIGIYMSRDWDEKVGHAWVSSMLLQSWMDPAVEICAPALHPGIKTPNFTAWLDDQRPEVVVSYDGILEQVVATGRRVPDDIGFASLSLRADNVRLSGIHQNNRLIGRKAVELLVDMLQRGERGVPEVPSRTLVEGVWMAGETLRGRAGIV